MALHINTFSFSAKSANVLRTSVGEALGSSCHIPRSGSGQAYGHSQVQLQGAPTLVQPQLRKGCAVGLAYLASC